MADGVSRLTSETSFTTEWQGHDGIDQALHLSAELFGDTMANRLGVFEI